MENQKLEKRYILTVDDYKPMGMVFESLLELSTKYEYDIQSFTDNIGFLNMFRKNPLKYAVVLVDWEMPRMNGAEVISLLRKINPSVKIIVVSAWAEGIDRNRGQLFKTTIEKSNPDLIIPKPFSFEIIDIIDNIVDKVA